MHEQTGELFLVREIDLESLASAVLTLQVQVGIVLWQRAVQSVPYTNGHLHFSTLSLTAGIPSG